jgi:uncharacterized protein YjbI with pentapeptide repeats
MERLGLPDFLSIPFNHLQKFTSCLQSPSSVRKIIFSGQTVLTETFGNRPLLTDQVSPRQIFWDQIWNALGLAFRNVSGANLSYASFTGGSGGVTEFKGVDLSGAKLDGKN